MDQREGKLLCGVCGEVAAIFALGIPDVEDRELLVYSGITKSTTLDGDDAPRIVSWCASHQISRIHAYVKRYPAMARGLDAYCPACDSVYCRAHYAITEERMGGSYVRSHGQCPRGHRRTVDE